MIKFKSNVFHYKLMMQGYKPEKEKSLSSAQPPLSFEQVCPTWARKLSIGLDEQDVRTMAYDSKYCIVGEAWGYNGRHAGYYIAPLIPLIGCWKCVKFGREMGKIAKLHGQSCTSDLHPVINHFLEHWNKRHRDITTNGIFSVETLPQRTHYTFRSDGSASTNNVNCRQEEVSSGRKQS